MMTEVTTICPIRMTLHLNGRTRTAVFETVEQLWAVLEREVETGGQLILRYGCDRSFQISEHRRDVHEKDQRRAVQFGVGGGKGIWTRMSVWPDGEGWRVMLGGQIVRPEVAQPGQPQRS